MLLIALSPSKGQDFTDDIDELCPSTARSDDMQKHSLPILNQQKAMSKAKIKAQNKLSDALGDGAHYNWQNFNGVDQPAKCAIYGFRGAAYVKVDAATLKADEINFLADHLRINDPFYGYLKASTSIQPYRLEMTNKLVDEKLQSYWKDIVTTALLAEFAASNDNEKILLSAASEEYWGVFDMPRVKDAGITIIKADFHEDNRKAPGITLKYARGLIVRWCAINKPVTEQDIKNFDFEGYSYKSTAEGGGKAKDPTRVITFNRSKPEKAKPKPKKKKVKA